MEQISTDHLTEILEAKRGATCVGIIALTNPGMNKTSRVDGTRNQFFQDGRCVIVKVQRVATWFNCRYNKAVEKRVALEINASRANEQLPPLEGDDLQSAIDERFRKGSNWQQAVIREDGTQTPFAEHRKTHVLYLRTMFTRTVGDPEYIDTRTGERHSYEDLAQFLPIKYGAKNQGLPRDKQVQYNTWKLEGIRALRMDGKTYRIRPPLEAEAEAVFAVMNRLLDKMQPPVPVPDGDDALPNE